MAIKATAKTVQQKATDAHQRGSYWLAEANEALEADKPNYKRAEMCERKAQYWLDRLNKLENLRGKDSESA